MWRFSNVRSLCSYRDGGAVVQHVARFVISGPTRLHKPTRFSLRSGCGSPTNTANQNSWSEDRITEAVTASSRRILISCSEKLNFNSTCAVLCKWLIPDTVGFVKKKLSFSFVEQYACHLKWKQNFNLYEILGMSPFNIIISISTLIRFGIIC